jgi:hypothetical protein
LSQFDTNGAQPIVAVRPNSIQVRLDLICAVIDPMTSISEHQLSDIVDGIVNDQDVIIRHNPIGGRDEILLWMLMSCLVSYLSLDAVETPCFTGRPDAETYRQAIRFILTERKLNDFDVEPYLAKLSQP